VQRRNHALPWLMRRRETAMFERSVRSVLCAAVSAEHSKAAAPNRSASPALLTTDAAAAYTGVRPEGKHSSCPGPGTPQPKFGTSKPIAL